MIHPVTQTNAIHLVGRPQKPAQRVEARPQTVERPPPWRGEGFARPQLARDTLLTAQQSETGSKRRNPQELTDEQKEQVQALKRRDAEVRRHERAHAAAGGPYAGMPVYDYTRGPDGHMYAVGGEVAIDTSPASTPEATIQKMEVVIRAALAPADPSPQDIKVAATARQIKAEAIGEKRAEEREEQEEASKNREEAVHASQGTGRDFPQAAELYRRTAELLSGLAQSAGTPAAIRLVA